MKEKEKKMNKGKMKGYGKVIMKTVVVIGICMVIDSAMAGITDAQIKAASKSWVATINDWTPGVVGGGMVLDYFILGASMGGIVMFGFKIFNKRFGKKRFQAITYWYLPTSKRLKGMRIPPSHVRVWGK